MALRDIALSNDGFIIKNGDIIIIDGAEAVRQKLELSLTLWYGEWFLDTEKGMPYLTDVLGKQMLLTSVIAVIKMKIMEVEGITKIEKFLYEFDRKNRKLNIDFSVLTEYGIIEVKKEI